MLIFRWCDLVWKLTLPLALGVGLAWVVLGLAQAAQPAPPLASQVGETCFATPNNGTTVFSSTTAEAVRAAVGAAAPNGVVKMAGYCPGVLAQGGTTQTVLLTQSLTLAGGYTLTNWTTPNRLANPTTLDAQGGGRVISTTDTVLAMTLQDFTVTNGYITATLGGYEYGGGVYAAGALTLLGMTVHSNTITGTDTIFSQHGGGVYVVGPVLITNTTFTANTARSYGGGLWAGSSAQITGSVFSDNITRLNCGCGAGGARIYNGSPVFITNTLFQRNLGNDGGGAMLAYVTLRNVSFISNTAYNGGGAWFVNGDLAGVRFEANTAHDSGGALFQGTSSLTGVTFISNTADLYGAGGASFYFSNYWLTNTTFLNNQGIWGGGVFFYGNGGQRRIVNGLFAGNSATVHGAALAVDNFNAASARLEMLHTTIVGPATPSGAAEAIYISVGTAYLTNTLVASHTIGLERTGGALNENYTLFSGVTTPYSGAVGNGSSSFTGTAAFYDTTNYTLTAGSAALDTGANSSGLNRDFFGNPRPRGRAPDIGYYESPYALPLTFTLTAMPAHLFANGLDQAVLTVTAQITNGTPWSGQVVTLTAPLGTLASPVVALNANGVATTTYTAGIVPGAPLITATLNDLGAPKAATTTITLKANPLIGDLDAVFGGNVITYTFVVTNVNALTQTVNMSGSVPAGASLVSVTGGVSVGTGGDYGFGYVAANNLVLGPNASHTLRWTVQFIGFSGDVFNQAHAESATARLQLPTFLRVYRQLLMPVYGVP